MRTTLNMDDGLMREARKKAAAEGRTLTSVIEEALRVLLRRPSGKRERFRLR
ncbi:MAG: type II toxin-antitoxin system VapB family antitoxin, partial [Gemmatimonadota bacterium]